MDIYNEHFKMWLFDEEIPITCTFVANELGINTNVAKQMLYQYSQDNSTTVEATYLVSGATKSKSHCVMLVKEGRLKTVIEGNFDTVLSKHVYALSSKEEVETGDNVSLISKKFATKLWYGDFQQRKNLLNDSGDLGQRFRKNTGSSIKCEACSKYNDSGRSVAVAEEQSSSSMFGSSNKKNNNSFSSSSSSSSKNKKNSKIKKTSVASFFGTKKTTSKNKTSTSKQTSLFQKKKIAVASPPRVEVKVKKTKKKKMLVDDDDDDDDDDDEDVEMVKKNSSSSKSLLENSQQTKSKRMVLDDDDDDDDDDDEDEDASAGSTQVHVSNSPTVSLTSSDNKNTSGSDSVSVANSMEVNTPLSPTQTLDDANVEENQTESPTLNKPLDTDDSPTEEPPTMFSTDNAEDNVSKKTNPKKKKYKKVLQNKTYQNDQGYFVTKSEYVEVTDDEAEDEDEAPKKMMNLKRKSPSVTKKKNFSSSNGGKAKKKQKSLMGFFSKRK